jgi:hypothetical protein
MAELQPSRRVQQAIDRIGPVDGETMRKLLSTLDEVILPTDFLNVIDAYERTREYPGY